MTTTSQTATPSSTTASRPDRLGSAACAAGAVLAVALVPLAGELAATDGEAMTAELVDEVVRMQIVSGVAVVATAALVLAAVRLGRRLGGDAGRVATGAGVAVAVLLSAYYAAFAAGAVVGAYALDAPSGAVGESALVMANVAELTRYGAGFALAVAAVAGRHRLTRPLTITAAVLAVASIAAPTAWVAAILIPVWLGVAGARSVRR